MKAMWKPIAVAVLVLVIGLVIGFLVGRYMLEREWSQPYTEANAPPTKFEPNNLTPLLGTRVLRPMPIGKSRAVLRSMTAGDPVVSPVAAVGDSDDGYELHVVVENRGTCTVTSLTGVAYGFDPRGKPAVLNKGGETFVAFESKRALEPGKKLTVAGPLKNINDATLALAHVDSTTCSDGTRWARK